MESEKGKEGLWVCPKLNGVINCSVCMHSKPHEKVKNCEGTKWDSIECCKCVPSVGKVPVEVEPVKKEPEGEVEIEKIVKNCFCNCDLCVNYLSEICQCGNLYDLTKQIQTLISSSNKEAVEKAVNHLIYVLPMAKAYAHENNLGANQAIVNDAEEYISKIRGLDGGNK